MSSRGDDSQARGAPTPPFTSCPCGRGNAVIVTPLPAARRLSRKSNKAGSKGLLIRRGGGKLLQSQYSRKANRSGGNGRDTSISCWSMGTPRCAVQRRSSSILGALAALGVMFGIVSSNRDPDAARSFDAGALFQDSTPSLVHTFRLRNTTDRTVRIVRRVCSCTCTSNELGKAVLAPGEATELTMRVHTSDAYRAMTVQCRLVTDSPVIGEVPYSLAFTSFPRVSFSSETVRLAVQTVAHARALTSPAQADFDVDLYSPVGPELDALVEIEAPEPLAAAFDWRLRWNSSSTARSGAPGTMRLSR